MDKFARAAAPPPPKACLCLGVTGHRAAHPLMQSQSREIAAALDQVFDLLGAEIARHQPLSEAGVRLHSMLADGADQLAARAALSRNWALVAPLPFGAEVNRAINARPQSAADARALLSGQEPKETAVAARAQALGAYQAQALVFELGERDEEIAALFVGAFEAADSRTAQADLEAAVSARVALAARVMIEQCDLLIAIWDGAQTRFIGGTGHTIQMALSMGAAVIWIDPQAPQDWRVLQTPEALLLPGAPQSQTDRAAQIAQCVQAAMQFQAARKSRHGQSDASHSGIKALEASHWHPRSDPLWHAYRRIEAVFGREQGKNPFRSLRQTYETPEAIASGSGAQTLRATRAAAGTDAGFIDRIAGQVLPRFAWADAISACLSDTYRSGMVINFVLSALAIVGGIAYLPLADVGAKWAFALFELVLLSTILFITLQGQRRRWHGRWFETRRAAEYLRHAPILLALGAARAPGRWPRGADTTWPEWYARQTLREVGLPRIKVTTLYLRQCLEGLLDRHVTQQRDYHHSKAQRLTKVHHNLDRLSERLFQLAVASVALYLVLQIAPWLHWLGGHAMERAAKIFTFLGVLLPTFGGAIAGIRYFGDFERFAAISEVTAQKLEAVHARIQLLLAAPVSALEYQAVSELAHAADDIVVSEIENWQAVFGGKQITVPV